MTTQEINRYIAVASKWEQKFSTLSVDLSLEESRNARLKSYINTLESQLKIQDNAIERKDAEIEKLKADLDSAYNYAFWFGASFVVASVIIAWGLTL